MDLGWIVTFASDSESMAQISVASGGGSGTPVPDVSIEVDNLDETHARMVKSGINVEYGANIRALGRPPILCPRSVWQIGEHPGP